MKKGSKPLLQWCWELSPFLLLLVFGTAERHAAVSQRDGSLSPAEPPTG